jgi:hypothetical protein
MLDGWTLAGESDPDGSPSLQGELARLLILLVEVLKDTVPHTEIRRELVAIALIA